MALRRSPRRRPTRRRCSPSHSARSAGWAGISMRSAIAWVQPPAYRAKIIRGRSKRRIEQPFRENDRGHLKRITGGWNQSKEKFERPRQGRVRPVKTRLGPITAEDGGSGDEAGVLAA